MKLHVQTANNSSQSYSMFNLPFKSSIPEGPLEMNFDRRPVSLTIGPPYRAVEKTMKRKAEKLEVQGNSLFNKKQAHFSLSDQSSPVSINSGTYFRGSSVMYKVSPSGAASIVPHSVGQNSLSDALASMTCSYIEDDTSALVAAQHQAAYNQRNYQQQPAAAASSIVKEESMQLDPGSFASRTGPRMQQQPTTSNYLHHAIPPQLNPALQRDSLEAMRAGRCLINNNAGSAGKEMRLMRPTTSPASSVSSLSGGQGSLIGSNGGHSLLGLDSDHHLQSLDDSPISFNSSSYNALDKLKTSVHSYGSSSSRTDPTAAALDCSGGGGGEGGILYSSQTAAAASSDASCHLTDNHQQQQVGGKSGRRKKMPSKKKLSSQGKDKDDSNHTRRPRSSSSKGGGGKQLTAADAGSFSNNRMSTSNDDSRSSPSGSNRSSMQSSSFAFSGANSLHGDDDEDDSWKICGVCNDKATGYHFNAMTCEGCKGFFRRSIKNQKNFVCLNNNQCTIDKEQRKHCQACRLRLCFEIGMKKECIMTEKEIEEKRQLVMANRQKRAAQSWRPSPFSSAQQDLLKKLTKSFMDANVLPDGKVIRNGSIVKVDSSLATLSLSGYDEELYHLITHGMDQGFDNRQIQQNSGGDDKSEPQESHVTHFTDIMDFSIKQILKFCKEMDTLFEDLFLEDKVSLLKSGCSELMFIKANYSYDKKRDVLTLGPNISYTRESFIKGGMSPQYAERYLKFHKDLAELEPDDSEMTCLSIISLFSADRCSLKQKNLVIERQEEIAVILQAYIETKMMKQSTRCAKMMDYLVRLRNLNQLCADSFKTVEKNFGEKISPLVKEVQPAKENL